MAQWSRQSDSSWSLDFKLDRPESEDPEKLKFYGKIVKKSEQYFQLNRLETGTINKIYVR